MHKFLAALFLACPASAFAQTTYAVSSQSALQTAISTAVAGDTIVLGADVTLTSALPTISTNITLDGGGHTIDGSGQFRGIIVGAVGGTTAITQVPVTVTIQNLTIANTFAAGGAGGTGDSGGGGAGGLGGALFVAPLADVTLSGVSLVTNTATGGAGGAALADGSGGGGGGGLLGAGGSGGANTGGTGGSGLPGVLGSAGGDGAANTSVSAGTTGFGGGGGGLDGFGGYGGGGGGYTAAAAPQIGGFAGGTSGPATSAGGGGGGALGGAMFVAGGGSVTLSGTLTINGNTVIAGAGGPGGTGGQAFGSGLFLAGGAQITFSSAAGVTQVVADAIGDELGSDPLSDGGSAALLKTGAGTLVLSGVNTYAGGTTVTGGTLSIASGASLGSVDSNLALDNGSTLAITGSTSIDQRVFLGGTATISAAQGRFVAVNGPVRDDLDVGATGSLTVDGGGVLALTNAANSYSNGTNIVGNSTVVVTDDGALGTASGAIALGNATSAGTLRYGDGTTLASSRTFTINGGGGTIDTEGSAAIALTGTLGGAGLLTKAGTGTLVLSAANAYSGGSVVKGGLLRAGAAGAFGGGSMQVDAGAALDLNGFNQSVTSLNGAGTIALGTAALTTGGNNAASLFSGAITGAGSLTKIGTGILTLTGANSYSGGTFVNQGTLAGTTAGLQGAIDTAGAATVLFDQTFSGTFSGTIGGAGSVRKTGTGTVTFLGSNTYAGGTSVTGGGGLSIASNAALGAATGTVALGDALSSGALTFTNTDVFAASRSFVLGSGGGVFNTAGGVVRLAGGISGAGSLTKTGAGVLELAGSNSYLGQTLVTAGTLRAGAANVFNAGQLLFVGSGSSVDLNGFRQTVGSIGGSGAILLGDAALTTGGDNSSGVFAGAISGRGSLSKVGTGALVLTGANTYSGGTDVLGGAVVGNTGSLQGNIRNDAVVQFDQNTDGTYAGSMSGTGILSKSGAGILTLAGANTFTGGTIVTGGGLAGTAASLRGLIVNNANLTFGGAADGTFAGTLQGTGAVSKLGTGTLTLSGNHSDTGLFTVSQGTLALNGNYGGSMNVAAGAALRATGSVAGSLNLAGTLVALPPGSLATDPAAGALDAASGDAIEGPSFFTIGQNLTATNGSGLEFFIGPGASPTVLVGGTAALTGTRLTVSAPSIGTSRSASFLALMALNGLSLSNTDVATDTATVVPVLKQDRNSLYVTLLNLNVPLASVGGGPGVLPVAAALDRSKLAATGDAALVIRELTALDDSSLRAALEQIGGQLHATVLQTAVLDAEIVNDAVRDQLVSRQMEEGDDVRWWAESGCQRADFKSTERARGGHASVCAGAGGADRRLSGQWTVGGGGSFTGGRMGLGELGSGDYSAPRAFGYVGYQPRGFGIRAGGSGSRSSYRTKREIAFRALLPPELGGQPLGEGIDRTAEAEQHGTTSDAWSDVHGSRKVRTYTVEGLIGLRHARISRGAFQEQGALSLSLQAADEVLNLTQTNVRVHTWRRTGAYRPFLDASYRRELAQGSTEASVSLSGLPSSDFIVEGLNVPASTYAAKVGVTFNPIFGQATMTYEYKQATAQRRHAVTFRVRFK